MNLDIALYVAHCFVYCGMVKEDFPEKPSEYAISRRYPLSVFIACMLSCFSGEILANLLLSEPPLKPFQNQTNVLIAAVVWYALFYSPLDVVPRIYFRLPVKMFLGVLVEVHRAYEIDAAVTVALTYFPHSYLLASVIGAVKGSGPLFMKLFYRLACGVWFHEDLETMKPSLATKLALLGAFLFVLDKKGLIAYTPVSGSHLFVIIATIFVIGLVLTTVFKIDPFDYLTDATWRMFTLQVFQSGSQAGIDVKDS